MAAPPLSDDQRLAWLRLWRSENVGPVTFRQLLRRFGSAEAALDALPELARRGGRLRPLAICPQASAERELAEPMARELAQQGWVVVSGLARGIDSASHRGALAGGTIAVLAGGLDRPYPPESEPLYHAIAERGLVVSEMPLGRVPQARH